MNIAQRLVDLSKAQPQKIAVKFPVWDKKKNQYNYKTLTFKELDLLSNRYATSLSNFGLKKGDKVLLFLKPCLDFSAMTFALFKMGLIPIFIDPGMGRKNLLKCIADVKPDGLIAEKEVHFIRHFFPKAFKSVKYFVTNGRFSWGNQLTLRKMKKEKIQAYSTVNFEGHETAAILFTSGGTGSPKGVVYTHTIFDMQTTLLKEMYHLSPDDIDLPGFPLFSLFTIAMGMTSCIPDMDPSKPAQCHPKKLVQNIIDCEATFVAGSPSIWERVADYCIEFKITLPTVKYIVMFGAPVSVTLHKKFKTILTNGTTYTPYGATEALPVCNIDGKTILVETALKTESGAGTCIGKTIPGIEAKIIKITENVITQFNDAKILPNYEIGEIIVSGTTVTKEYFELPEKTQEAKIYENEKVWHRMGDIGYIDDKNRLWFLGRKSHRVETINGLMTPISCEAIFNRHPHVKRSALVGLGERGNQIPAIVIERFDHEYLSGKDRSIFESELISLAKKYDHTKDIQKIYLSKLFPVDVRHNIKIDRTKLKEEIENVENN